MSFKREVLGYLGGFQARLDAVQKYCADYIPLALAEIHGKVSHTALAVDVLAAARAGDKQAVVDHVEALQEQVEGLRAQGEQTWRLLASIRDAASRGQGERDDVSFRMEQLELRLGGLSAAVEAYGALLERVDARLVGVGQRYDLLFVRPEGGGGNRGPGGGLSEKPDQSSAGDPAPGG